MAMSAAERQARYRERQKASRYVTAEDAIEAARCRLVVEFVDEARDAEHAAFLRDVTAQPLWQPGGFADWLDAVLVREIEDQIGRAYKARSKRRRA